MKILIVGGANQGKHSYAADRYGKPAISALHLMVRRLMRDGQDPREAVARQLADREDWVVVCDEVGCGVVPLDPFDRDWRESVGRICCTLAQQADIVERMHCGIPQRIKGQCHEA